VVEVFVKAILVVFKVIRVVFIKVILEDSSITAIVKADKGVISKDKERPIVLVLEVNREQTFNFDVVIEQ
jgi:hypothetical protein